MEAPASLGLTIIFSISKFINVLANILIKIDERDYPSNYKNIFGEFLDLWVENLAVLQVINKIARKFRKTDGLSSAEFGNDFFF